MSGAGAGAVGPGSEEARAVYLVDAARTPIGRFRGGLSSMRADDMAAHVMSGLLQRQTQLAGRVDHVVMGATNQAGEDNRNVARMALLLAGMPYEVPALTVNRLCGSGLEAIDDARRRIALGEAHAVIAGGVENMSRAPLVMAKASSAFARGTPEIHDSSLGWRFANPRMAARFPLLSMGETAEEVAREHQVSREDQDAFALRSQQRAAAAWQAGVFADEVLPVTLAGARGAETRLERDESPRADTSLEKLARLKPVFRDGGSVTAGNASPLNDGAAAVLLCSGALVAELGLSPMLRLVSSGTAGVHPSMMGTGPVPATRQALARAGLGSADLDLVELNEAFAAQSVACVRALDLDPDCVNVRGGAIALGHPIGASGARIVTTLAHAMCATSSCKFGLASLCIGVGQGISMIFERTD